MRSLTEHDKPVIIGLVAVDGNGKTTLAKALAAHGVLPNPPTGLQGAATDSIKKPLITAACALLGIPLLETTEQYQKLKEDNPQLRRIMYELGYLIDNILDGGHLMREWLKVALQEVPPPRLYKRYIILDDVRTPEQVEELHNSGGITLYIPPRAGLVVSDTALNVKIQSISAHKCDYWIRPGSTASEVHQVQQILDTLLGVQQ